FIGSLAGQSCKQMALHIQLITDRGLSLEDCFIIRHSNLHRLVVVETEVEPGLRELLKVSTNANDGFHDSELMLERLSPEVGTRNAGRQSQPPLGGSRFLGGRMS